MGAAIHAASLAGEAQNSMLLDVTPLDLRIGVAGGLTEPVIERNTPVPIEQTRTFTTFQDHQESVQIRVYQGDHRQAEDNALLGQFEFSGFEKGLRSDVKIDVTFEIDADGIVNVTASDQATGQEASTRISLSSGLEESQIEQILEADRAARVQTADAPRQSPGAAGAPAAQAPPSSTSSVAAAAMPTAAQAEPEPSLFGDGSEDLSVGRDEGLDLELDDDCAELELIPDEDLMQMTQSASGIPDAHAITLDVPADQIPDDGDFFDAPGGDLSSAEIDPEEEY
jgi:hypothetical protein